MSRIKKKNNTGDVFTFGAKFSEKTYVGDDGKEYYKALKDTGITLSIGAIIGSISSCADGRNSKEYKKFVKDVLERDNYTCQRCGSTINPVVHHILNYRDHKDLRIDVDNGITLCECCHSPMILGGFHQIYGTYNNTKGQLEDYINSYKKV